MAATINSTRLNVILDIDETFVHYLRKDSLDNIPKTNFDKYEYVGSSKNAFVLRPHLREFLEFLFANCTVSLWTWSEKEYAEGVADMIKNLVGKRPAYILHDTHAEQSAGPLGNSNTNSAHGNSKDLNMLWYGSKEQGIAPLPGFHECNTILVDDLPSNSVNTSNRQNSITIAPFALFGEVKNRSDPYLSFTEDDCLKQIMEIIRRILPHLPERCTGDKLYENVFSKGNVASYGLRDFVKNIRLNKFKKVDGKKVYASHSFVEAIAVTNGHAHLISGGGRRTRQFRRKHRTTRKNLKRR